MSTLCKMSEQKKKPNLYIYDLKLSYMDQCDIQIFKPYNYIGFIVRPTRVYLLDFFCSCFQLYVLLSPYLCFI